MQTLYCTNLTDEQWEIIRNLLPEAQRPCAVCPHEPKGFALPHNFPK